MAYEPTIWQAGDTITSAKLNKLEQGVAEGGGGVFIVEGVIDQVELTDSDEGK